jgi:NhaP-type Na+/H+ or K+/H+ antiporter
MDSHQLIRVSLFFHSILSKTTLYHIPIKYILLCYFKPCCFRPPSISVHFVNLNFITLLISVLIGFHCAWHNHLKTFHPVHNWIEEQDEKTRRKRLQRNTSG